MTMDNAQVTGLGELGQYIQHKHNCTLGMRMGKECECGLTDTLARHRLEPVGWMGIESAPKDGTFIDLWLDANGEKPARRVVDCFWDKKAGHWRRKGSPFHFGQFAFPQTPLAWMPLPSAPGTTTPEPVAEIERLRAALRPFAAMAAAYDPVDGDDGQWAFAARPTIGQLRAARAALGDAS